uniref:Uncharacterized protein MANES_12G062500 n=1 Tax=Rhizophora mucronata TaxID=61149 RepID=A0A2P2NZN9_RHIMU
MDLDIEKPAGKRKRSNLEDDGDDHHPPAIGLENLPREIVDDILLRLPITSVVQFKCVCRSWRALAQDPHLKNLYLASRTEKSDPCLIIHCDIPIRSRLNFVDFSAQDDEGKREVKRIHVPFSPSMPEFDVVGSCNGLLLLSDSLYIDSLYVYNPFTREYTELPKSLQYLDQEVVFGFGFHPKTKEYKVIKVIYYRNGHGGYPRARRIIYPQSQVQILTLGNPVWRSLGKVSYRLVRRPSEALVNGRLHWVSRPSARGPSRRLVSFDLADEQFREVPKPACGGLNRYNYHAVALGGCLSAAAYCNHGKMEIWVMKEYDVESSWVKQYSFGSYMPKGLKQTLARPYKSYKSSSRGRFVRVICLLKNGELLLEYKSRVLVSYDPKEGRFKDLMLQGIPKWFETVAHVGSLNWINTPL